MLKLLLYPKINCYYFLKQKANPTNKKNIWLYLSVACAKKKCDQFKSQDLTRVELVSNPT